GRNDMAGGSPIASGGPEPFYPRSRELLRPIWRWRAGPPLSPDPEEHLSAELAAPLGAASGRCAARTGRARQFAHRPNSLPGFDRLFRRFGVDGSRSAAGADRDSSII